MKKTLIAACAALMTLSALPASAADLPGQSRPNAERHDNTDSRGDRSGQADNDRRYGTWDSRWGARPPAPPRHFTRVADWHRHVRACQQRYRSYNAATDRYVPSRGRTAVCRL